MNNENKRSYITPVVSFFELNNNPTVNSGNGDSLGKDDLLNGATSTNQSDYDIK